MSQKRILFLGGAYSQIPIIKEAKKRNWYIITCDYLPDNPGHKLANEYYNISTTNFEGVLALAIKVKPDFVFAYASDPAAATAAFVAEQLGLPGNSYKSICTLAEKDLFRAFLTENGFNAPQAVSIKTTDNVYEKISALKLPIIVKPTDSSGSKGVSKVTSPEGLQSAVDYAYSFSRNKRIIAEEFIECDKPQLHGDGFVVKGELIFSYLGDHHYDKKINPFVPFSTTWPSRQDENIIQKIEIELKRAIKLSGYRNGAVNIEVRVNNKGEIFIMEIGPRSGGNFVPQVINYATGFDMVSASLDVIDRRKVQCHSKGQGNTAYYVIHTEHNGILNKLSLNTVITPFVKEFHQYIQPGEKVISFQGSNAAIGVLILLFNNREEMECIMTNISEYINLKIEYLL